MKAPVTPGELRHLVQIVRDDVTGQDEHGQPITSSVTLETVGCKVEPLQGRDIEYARQLYHLATHRLTMRYTANLSNTVKIKFGPRWFHVGHVNDLEERNVWMVALCSEGTDP